MNSSRVLLAALVLFPVFGGCQTRAVFDAAFYRGLLAENPAPYFEQALRSPNPLIREAAAEKIPRRLPGTNAAAAVLGERADRIRRWEEAVSGAGPGGPFGQAEFSAMQGRFSVARSAFGTALLQFQAALEADPSLFLRHPETLTDLGRSFQFGGAGEEGPLLFRGWEAALASGNFAGEPGIPDPDSPEGKNLRYLLLYFAGRMERQRGDRRGSTALFEAALELAPDSRQKDACIWYILDMAWQDRPDEMLLLLGKYLPRVWRYSVVEDILEQYARHCVTLRRWGSLGDVYGLLLPQKDGSARAQYAYLLGRASELGYWGTKDGGAAFFRAARDERAGSFYYRALASARLGEGPLEIPRRGAEPGKPRSPSRRDEMAFLMGFFEHDAAEFVWPYVSALAGTLSVPELRVLVRALQDAGRQDESLRLAAAWTEREDYRPDRADMELFYPRPFQDLVEGHSASAEIPPWLFWGLVRTESAFMPEIRSGAGAAGLSQLMEDTALEMAGRIRRQGGSDSFFADGIDLSDPDTNLRLGTAYFRHLQDRLGNLYLSILSYNGGITRVRRWKQAAGNLPMDLFAETVEFRETRLYGRRVSSAAAAYGYLYYGLTMESILSDILN